jgi:translation initiation factor 4G
MSKASTTSKQQPSPAITPNASAWSRGPPTAASNTSSNVPSAVPSPSPPNGASANESAAGAAPVAIGGSASKRGSLMVGGNGDVMPRGKLTRVFFSAVLFPAPLHVSFSFYCSLTHRQGNLAFGTVDSPNPLLSSSPAAPAATGSHLADAVKSFGSIDAETTATGASMIRPPRRTSGGANPTAPSGLPQKKLDVHSLFAGKPQSANSASAAPMSPSQQPTQVGSPIQDRRQSIGQNYAGANGLPATAPHPYGQSAAGQPPHLRPPQSQGQPRSPVMGVAQQQQFAGQVPQGQPFRVPQQPQMQGSPAPVRPGGASGPMGVPRPMMGQPTMPFMPPGQNPGYGMMYPSYVS